jgi:hypothetical protein
MRGGATVANEACAVARAYGGNEVFGGVAAYVECVEPMLIPSKAGALQSVSPCLGFAPHNPERSNHFDALEEYGNLLAGGIRLNMPPPRRTALLQTRQGRRICGPHCQGLRVEASAYLSLRWHSTIRSAASPVTTRPAILRPNFSVRTGVQALVRVRRRHPRRKAVQMIQYAAQANAQPRTKM